MILKRNQIVYIILFYFIIDLVKWLILDFYYILCSVDFLEMTYSILTIVIGAGYLSLLERQVVAIIQQRIGPSFTGGLGGALQPVADGFKLLIKEIIIPSKSKTFLYLIAPVYTFTISIGI